MAERPAILVFHGITMSGASMRRHLGPIGAALEDEGCELVYLDAPNVMSPAQVEGAVDWAARVYVAKGQDAHASFREGVFWDGPHRDWFAAQTDAEGRKDYRGLAASLDTVRAGAEGRRVTGVLGFSQGCAMAGLVAGLAARGHLPFGDMLERGVFLSGFKPVFDLPAVDPWPVPGVRGLFAVGSEDAIFPEQASIEGLASEFEQADVHRIEGLPHVVPTDPTWVDRIVSFVLGRA